jgi:hypothetical protein
VHDWPYKTDSAGKPRRFLSHREAASWTALKVGKFFGLALLFVLLEALIFPEESGRMDSAVYSAFLLVVFWLLISAALYLYVALSGGVMGRDERRRYGLSSERRSV